MVKNKLVKQGFTLIEILVIVMAIGLFFGLSLRYFNDFNEVKKLEYESEKIAETLRQARKSALSGDRSQLSGETCILSGYRVDVSVSENAYSQFAICDGDKLVSQTDLPLEINPCQSASIFFKQFGLGATDGLIKIINTRSSKCREISINESGDINISNLINNCSCN